MTELATDTHGAGSSARRAISTAAFERVGVYCAAIVVIIAGTALVGWALDVPVLRQYSDSSPPMRVNTALGFLCAGIAVLARGRDAGAAARVLANALATLVLAMGVVSLVESIAGVDLGVDDLLVADPAGAGPRAGLMAPAAAGALIALGVAIALADAAIGAVRAGHYIGRVLALCGLFAVICHLYDVSESEALGPFAAVSVPAAFCMLFGGVAILCTRLDMTFVAPLTSEGPGGLLARRMLPISVALPVTFGWLRLEGERAGGYSTEVGVALHTMAIILGLGLVVLLTADALDRADEARKREEEERKRSDMRFRRLSESGVLGVIVKGTGGAILEANEAFLRMTSYRQEDVAAGRLNWTAMTPPEWLAHNARIAEDLRELGRSGPWEKEYLCSDGARVPVLMGMASLDAESSICFVVDLTEQKAAEAAHAAMTLEVKAHSAGRERAETALRSIEDQLRQSQKMEAVGRLAGGVAHDFNNMLSVILVSAELALEDLPSGDPVRADLEEIRKAGLRATELTRQLLMFSRQQVLAPQVLDLNASISSMHGMLARLVGEDIDLQIAAASNIGSVRADPTSIEQILMNLVVNARDAMPTGGRVVLETANVELDDTYAAEHLDVAPGRYVMLAVTDTGGGMDRATQARIFDPFFTTKDKTKGTGLGLSTVFGIVKQSEGHVFVYSELGKGSTFKIYLPRVDARPDVARSHSLRARRRATETVLLAEDDAAVRGAARTILQRAGYQVIEVGSGAEALLASEQNDGEIHVLLTDVVMPDMSGPALAERLLLARPKMKVICMSGYTDDAALRHGALRPGLAFLQKPFTVERLTAAVRDALDGDGT